MSKKALAVHAAKFHSYRSLVRHYVLDGRCPCCAKDFTHRSRLAAHLQGVQRCFERVRACFPPFPQPMVLDLAKQDLEHTQEMKKKGWLSTKALIPVVKAFGPTLPPCGSAEAREMQQKWTARRPPDQCPLFDELEGFCHALDQEHMTTEVPSANDNFIPFVVQSEGGSLQGCAGCFQMQGLARLHAERFDFYSGYRRPGDLQHQIDHVVQESTQIFCVSVDFCIQKERGDLTLNSNKLFWLDRIYSGAVCGVGGTTL